MIATKKRLSYFRLKLKTYLGEHFLGRMNDNAFVITRVNEASTAYYDVVTQGLFFPEVETMADEILHHDLHFLKYDALISVLEQEFEKELLSPPPERLIPILPNNRTIQAVFVKYELTNNFAAGTGYDRLYTRLTGTIVLLIKVNGFPTIGGENMTRHFTIGSFCSVKNQDKHSTPHVKSFVNTCFWIVRAPCYCS